MKSDEDCFMPSATVLTSLFRLYLMRGLELLFSGDADTEY
jgi:hypothetical protein